MTEKINGDNSPRASNAMPSVGESFHNGQHESNKKPFNQIYIYSSHRLSPTHRALRPLLLKNLSLAEERFFHRSPLDLSSLHFTMYMFRSHNFVQGG